MAWQEEYKKMLKAIGIIEKDDIFTASFYGEISKLKDFIASGEYTTKDYNSALSLACERGNTEVVKLLLEVGANIKSIYDLGEHNVNMASRYGYIDIVKLLIENGAVFSGELGPLSVASQVGHINIVKLLVESGAKDLENALISAVSNNISTDQHLEIVKYLIEKGANNLNAVLVKASSYGHIEIVKYLIEKGATSFNDALINSASQGHLEIVKYLIEKGATDLDKSLISSVEHPDVLKYLLEKGANPNVSTKVPDYIKLGLSRPIVYGSNIDFIDISLLEFAVSKNQLESVRHIIASSQNILGYDNALNIAVKQNNIEIVKILISVIRNIDYKYLLVDSCHNKNIDMLKLLIKSGANINENLSTVSLAYYYLPSSQEKELDTIFLNAGVSLDVIRKIKNGTHESIPKFIQEIKYKKFYSKTNIDNFNVDIQIETLQQNEISLEQQKYNQSIIDVIESERKEQIDRIVASKSEEPIWNSVRAVISIFGVIPLDALEKSSGETKDFILKLMLIVKNYFGDTDLYYEKYIKTNKDWFEYWKNAFVWFRRCQTLDKTLIQNPEEPIKYPPSLSGKVLSKKKNSSQHNN